MCQRHFRRPRDELPRAQQERSRQGRDYVSVMKGSIRWFLVSVVACAMCSLATYRIAYRKAYLSGQVSMIHQNSKVTSLVTLGALQKLRGGDIPDGTRLLETFCFGQSEVFYHDPTYSDGKELAPGLLQYRAAYRTNSAEWSDTERKLEAQLAKVK